MIALIAPGPSATREQVARVEAACVPTGAVSTGFLLCTLPLFVAASDGDWWAHYHPHEGAEHYCITAPPDGKKARMRRLGNSAVTPNSGVLALDVAVSKGYGTILLLGFDMRGTHFFGEYTNGLQNTTDTNRARHMREYEIWVKENTGVRVVNCTTDSALNCFERGSLGDFVR